MNMTASKTTAANIDSSISKEEWIVRQELAACYRAFVHYGWTDSIFTHLSARVPNYPDQYIINPYGLLFHEVTASNLIKVDFSGEVVAGDYPYNEAGHAIHSAVLAARPDVNAVLHSHTRAGMAVSCMRDGLLPLTQQANEMLAITCRHQYDDPTDNNEVCQRLGDDIQGYWAMLMENHGLMSVGRNIGEAFYFLYTLENACKVQVDVMACKADFITPDKSVVDRLMQKRTPENCAVIPDAELVWQAVLRLVDEKYPDYKQ